MRWPHVGYCHQTQLFGCLGPPGTPALLDRWRRHSAGRTHSPVARPSTCGASDQSSPCKSCDCIGGVVKGGIMTPPLGLGIMTPLLGLG